MELKIIIKDGERTKAVKLIGDPWKWLSSIGNHIESFTKLMYDDKPDEQA